jgi:hypothetical protein
LEILGRATEDEMVLEFLRAEIENVPEWTRYVIEAPNLNDETENERRRCLLSNRGYGWNQFPFRDFPANVSWHHATLTVGELSSVRYMNREPTWCRFSEGTRSIPHGVRNIGKGLFPDDPKADPSAVISRIASGVEQERSFPELILVGTPDAAPEQLVLLEGHKRATAYVYMGKPAEIRVLTGFSPGMRHWPWS